MIHVRFYNPYFVQFFIKHRVIFVMRVKPITTNGVSFAYFMRETLPTPQDTILKYPPMIIIRYE